MAGTRGIARLRGEQLHDKIMRNNHFDEANKIDERYLNIDFHSHREILEDTKIDVFVQKNGINVSAGSNTIEVTADLLTTNIATDTSTEGLVLGAVVQLRKNGTQDFPFIDADGDRVYGKIRQDGSQFYLDFFSEQDGTETPYTFVDDEVIDYKYIVRTNLSVIPVDAIVSGGGGFVADAVDAKAYMNLLQIMKDLYGASGTLDNDGNANLETSIVDQITQEAQARIDGDNAILNDLASTAASKGASLVGVVADPNYSGVTVQDVLSDLAQRLKAVEIGSYQEVQDTHSRDAASPNNLFVSKTFTSLEERLVEIENTVDTRSKGLDDRITKLETDDEEEVYEAVGGETQYMFQNGVAKPKTVLVSINGAIQAPGINFEYLTDDSGNITGLNFAPDTLKVTNGIPDVLLVKYKKVL